ncbi:zinc finger protein 622 [Phtheirospermum japonicum]|uniref:Zinc finger protein 622 n=1 Tax=Phtheirospermum japonicum TaxID=374723 RepID=A0A830B1V0_9LAMI|nr:zinc finger protein 622 [Phtheirospermum japonicum]
MPGLTCNACNKEFADDVEQKLHYKSEWHRYNLKRKVAGVPGVTEILFQARQSALAEEKSKLDKTPMVYTCGLCDKGYRSSKAHAQHLNSKSHLTKASESTSSNNVGSTIIRPLPRRAQKESLDRVVVQEDEESEDSEWEEVDEEDLVDEAKSVDMDEDGDEDADFEDLDPCCCFMCDLEHDTIESCMVHMHKHHGFFIPDIEYLKDPKGLLTYLSLKVKKDLMCLYCNERRQAFSSLEAVRKHMEAKSHCKVHYGDGSEDEEAEIDEFYDYSSSYVDKDGKQLVAADDMQNAVQLGSGGSELIITKQNNGSKLTKMLGSREYLRYYRQKPRPTAANNALTAALASRYKSMGIVTVQSRENFVRMKVMKAMNKSGVEAMRSKMGMKSNVIRNLPNNVPY